MLDPYKVREDFPILCRKVHGKNLVYLDNTATTHKPRQVIEAIKEFYEYYNANIHRGVHELSMEASDLYEEAHKVVASFIGAEWDEVIFVRNATEALNLVAYSYGEKLEKGDEIVITLMEHHSNIVPWVLLAKRKKLKLKVARITQSGELDYDHLYSLITRKTKIVAVTQASNVVGTINNVREIAKVAHEAGSIIVVDGAQSVPHMPVNVKEIDADFLAFSGHKMLGPTGIGVLYGKREILEEMEPFLGGGDMIQTVHFTGESFEITWNKLPWKYEAGTPHIAGAIGLKAAVEYLQSLGMENVRSHEERLVKIMLEKMMAELETVKIYGPLEVEKRGGLVSFNLGGLHPHTVAELLNEEGIAVRSGFHCAQPLHEFLGARRGSVRASVYIYNTPEEVEFFVNCLKKIEAEFLGV